MNGSVPLNVYLFLLSCNAADGVEILILHTFARQLFDRIPLYCPNLG